MKSIKFLTVAVAGALLLTSCNQPKKGKSQTRESQSEEVNSKGAEALTDTITGRGCFEVVTEIPYDIPAQRFDETIQSLAHATGCFIEADLTKTGAVQVNAVNGKMSIRDAILTAIEGTSLKITEETETRIKVEFIE